MWEEYVYHSIITMPPVLLLYVELYMPLLTIIFYLFFRKKIDKKGSILFFYCVITLFLYFIIDILGWHKIHNLFLYNTYGLIDVLVVAYYLTLLIKNKRPGWVFYIGTGLYLLWWIFAISVLGNFYDLNLPATTSGNI